MLNNAISPLQEVKKMDYIVNLRQVYSDSESNVPAIIVRNAKKSYRNGEPVLNNLNMRVATGSIYGLLGASGCGKTTLLSTICGLRHLDSGTIKVFGHQPGTLNSETIGMMPQDVALYTVFTIEEILHYFGRLYSMTSVEVNARIEFLTTFLELPEPKKLIKNLSGGQQRRTSLAIAMLHSPKLLLLDEPTVGLDPLLRVRIWHHLQEICYKQNTTILVTTHYINEASQSSTVGIMRSGRLLAENSPQTLLQIFDTPFLEKVFLKLCADDDKGLVSNPQINYDNLNKSPFIEQEDNLDVTGVSYKSGTAESVVKTDGIASPYNLHHPGRSACISNHVNKVMALIMKTFIFLIRTPWFGLVVVLLPPIQIIIFLLIVGHDPKNIDLGIVNGELPHENLVKFCQTASTTGCFSTDVSCRFINAFPPDEFRWITYQSDEEALKGVQRGDAWGFLSIPSNYSQNMLERSLLKQFVTNSTLEGSTITGRLDVSFNIKSDFIKFKAYKYFQTFLKDLAVSCDSNPELVDIPLKFSAIYGLLDSTYLQYMQPGYFALTIILLPTSVALKFIKDRKDGTLERCALAGLGYSHMLIELLISDGAIVLAQILLSYGIMVISGITIEGVVWQFLLLVFLVGLVGLSIGFMAGQAVDEEAQAMFLILACYLPLMVTSGVSWPSESLPKFARFYNWSPTTMPIHSLRSIATRGWGILHRKVFPGFLIPIFWIIGLCIVSIIIRRIRNK